MKIYTIEITKTVTVVEIREVVAKNEHRAVQAAIEASGNIIETKKAEDNQAKVVSWIAA